MSKLEGSRILVTGASGRIGEQLTRLALDEGADVVGLSSKSNRLRELERELGKGFEAISADLMNPGVVPALQGEGRFDAVVCAAARRLMRMSLETTYSDIEEMIRVNVLTVMHAMHGCLPAMRDAGMGHFIVLGGGRWNAPHAPWRAAYTASTAALGALATAWRRELSKDNIIVTLIAPGLSPGELQGILASSSTPSSSPQPSMRAETPEEVAERILEAILNPRSEPLIPTKAVVSMPSVSRAQAESRERKKSAKR